MNLLLDTHVLIWSFTKDSTLSEEAERLIRDGDNVVFVSAVTAWEIAIKKAIGKLQVPGNYQEELHKKRFTPLDISTNHALAVEHLPLHHGDPFDRLLVAQAQLEKLTLVTRDERLSQYNVPIIRA